jgi:hypothetical protein
LANKLLAEFTVTAVIATVEITDDGNQSPLTAALIAIGEYDTSGEFQFDIPLREGGYRHYDVAVHSSAPGSPDVNPYLKD